MQVVYNYQIFFDETAKKRVIDLLTKLDLSYVIKLDKVDHQHYAEFYTETLENFPEEDNSFRYSIFDPINEEYLKIERLISTKRSA